MRGGRERGDRGKAVENEAVERTAVDPAAAEEAPGEEERRVTTLELFFDLVFVFTLTQLTTLLTADLSLEGFMRVVLIFAVLWWMYAAYAWLTNQVEPDRASRRVMLIVGMGAFLVCALSIPRTFSDGGLAFGLGYLGVVIVHATLYAQALPIRTLLGFVPANIGSALLIVGAGITDARGLGYALWVAAIVVQILTPYLFRPNEEINLHTPHFVERHGLLLIIAFGESIVAIGIGTGGLELDVSFFAAALLGLALVATLWWTYFGADEAGALQALSAEPLARRGRLAVSAYYQAFAPMLLGVVAIAAGVKKSLGHVNEELSGSAAVALAGGAVLYLLGDVVFRHSLGLGPIRFRVVAVVLVSGTTALGVYVNGAAQLIALIAVVGGALALEVRTVRGARR